MKKILLLSSILTLAAVSLVPITGCKTATFSNLSTNSAGAVVTNTVTQRVPDVAQMQTIAKSAAYLGTQVWLNGLPPSLAAHPNDRAKFVIARNALQTLIAAGNFNATALTAALQNLPITQLQGANGTLIVGEAVILWDQYGQQLASLDKAQVYSTYVQPIAQSILDGLNMALGPGN